MEIDPTANRAIKIVAVGDHLVGKSCAITTYDSYQLVSWPLILLSNDSQQYLTAQVAISESTAQPTVSQYGTYILRQGYNRKLIVQRSNQILLQGCTSLLDLFLSYWPRYLQKCDW